MEIALVVPSYFPRMTGNAVSARRILTGLVAAGHTAKIIDAETLGPYVGAVLDAYEPSITHAFHARRTGPLARGRHPFVLSLTGTDAGRDLETVERREEVLTSCRAADRLIVNHEATARPVLALDPSLAPRVRVIPKGVDLAASTWPMRAQLGIGADRVVFLLAGGWRKVKGQKEAIEALEGLDVELVLAGPPLDPAYTEDLKAMAKTRPWVHLTNIVPHAKMSAAYEESDVVLNCSTVEGMSNAILEAMYFRRAVLVSDIPGNRALVKADVHGLFYRGTDELRAQALRLRNDVALRATLGAAGAIEARGAHAPAREIEALLAVYGELVGK